MCTLKCVCYGYAGVTESFVHLDGLEQTSQTRSRSLPADALRLATRRPVYMSHNYRSYEILFPTHNVLTVVDGDRFRFRQIW